MNYVGSLRIFFVIDRYVGPSGGTERQLQLLIEGLVALGHEVRLFVLHATEFSTAGPGLACPIECLSISSILSADTTRRMLAFRRRIRTERPDVVHAFFNDAAILVPVYCKMRGVRVVTSRRDMGYWYTPAYIRALRVANFRVDSIVCNAHAVAGEVRRWERVRADKLRVIHNACHVPVARSLPPATLPSDESGSPSIEICLLANIRRIKRVEDFVHAAAIVNAEFPEVRFRVIGARADDEYFMELQAQVKISNLADKFMFMSASSTPIEIIRKCQIGVLTSASEGLSNTLMEYMACGLPVVCSDVGGNPELVEHGVEGFRYPAADVESLAGHLSTLCRDPVLRAQMGDHGRQRMAQFSLDRMIDEFCRVYRGMTTRSESLALATGASSTAPSHFT